MAQQKKVFILGTLIFFLVFFPFGAYSENKTYWEQYETAKGLIKQKQYQEALSILTTLSSQQANFNIYTLIGQIYSEQGHPDLALPYYQKAYQLAKESNSSVYIQMAIFNLARVELALKNSKAAEQHYNELLTYDLSPGDRKIAEDNLKMSQVVAGKQKTTMQIEEAQKYIAQGKGKAAFEQIQPLLNTNQSLVYIIAGDSFSLQENPKKALPYYQQAYQLAKSENNVTIQRVALFATAKMQFALHDIPAMKDTYKQLSLMNLSDDERQRVNAGLKYSSYVYANKKVQQKETIKEKVSVIAPQKTELRNRIAQIQGYIDQNNGRKALQNLASFPAKDKTAIYYLLMGHAYGLIEQPNKALENYQFAYKNAVNENNISVKRLSLFSIGRIQLALRHPKEARMAYLSVLKMNITPQDRETALKQLAKAEEMEALQPIQDYIARGDGMKAYQLVIPLIIKHRISKYYLLAADSLVAANRLCNALYLYKTAYHLACLENNIDNQRSALIGIGAMQMSLDQYVRATLTYRKLLTYQLDMKNYELAKTGLVNSLSYRGRNLTAYNEIPRCMEFSTPQMAVAALDVALWLNQSDVAKCLYCKYQPLLCQIKPSNYLARDLKNIEWLLPLESAPYQVSPEYYYSHDTESFTIIRFILNARRYWSQTWQTKLGVGYLNYAQLGHTFKGNSFYLGQAWNPSRFFSAEAKVNPTSFKNWDPFLWSATASFTPNDLIAVTGTVSKELLEAFPALVNRRTYVNYNLNLLLQPIPYVILTASPYRLYFNDNNRRNGYTAIGKVFVLPQEGIYLGYRVRSFSNAFRSPFYFSPEYYNEGLYLGGITHRIGDTWRYFIEGATGQQTIKFIAQPAGHSESWFYRLGVRGPLTKCMFLDVRYGVYSQAAAFSEATGYRYYDISALLNISF